MKVLKLTERLGCIEGHIKMFEDVDLNKRRAEITTRCLHAVRIF
jgi:hypothetical protein